MRGVTASNASAPRRADAYQSRHVVAPRSSTAGVVSRDAREPERIAAAERRRDRRHLVRRAGETVEQQAADRSGAGDEHIDRHARVVGDHARADRQMRALVTTSGFTLMSARCRSASR